MKLARRIVGVVALLVVVGVVGLGFALSHDAPCSAAPASAAGAPLMKAVVRRCYGSADVLRVEELAKPSVADKQVLVRVRAAALNPLDSHFMRGTPYLVRLSLGLGRPEKARLGVDFAGTVEAVGSSVRRFKPGDEVFGGTSGAFAEYLSIAEDGDLARKPSDIPFEQAAAVPIAGITALQALRDQGHLHSGETVLINGASGGVGTFAVQIAKAYGAEVTGVCSTRNLDMVRALGADHVIDYSREDFTRGAQRYDLIVDTVGNHPLLELRRVLTPSGIFVGVGGPSDGKWFAPMDRWLDARMLAPFVRQRLVMFLAELNAPDLAVLADLMREGKVKPVIDRRYDLSEAAEAMRYLEKGHARGKIILTVVPDSGADARPSDQAPPAVAWRRARDAALSAGGLEVSHAIAASYPRDFSAGAVGSSRR
jgi:NADPH:quinone reductase-like Zn-dependent oxidoreductase